MRLAREPTTATSARVGALPTRNFFAERYASSCERARRGEPGRRREPRRPRRRRGRRRRRGGRGWRRRTRPTRQFAPRGRGRSRRGRGSQPPRPWSRLRRERTRKSGGGKRQKKLCGERAAAIRPMGGGLPLARRSGGDTLAIRGWRWRGGGRTRARTVAEGTGRADVHALFDLSLEGLRAEEGSGGEGSVSHARRTADKRENVRGAAVGGDRVGSPDAPCPPPGTRRCCPP